MDIQNKKKMRRKITPVLSVVMILAVAECAQTVTAQERNEHGWYESTPDTAFVWHPEAIYVVWPDTELEFRLPHEQDRSGVANLLFRDRRSGEMRLLDSIRGAYNDTALVSRRVRRIPDARYARRFEPGGYDAILLYNNGKYITYDNLTIEKDVKMVVDMAARPVHPADQDSQKWLSMRKFTDPIGGNRTLCKNYATASDDKILGYVFQPWGFYATQVFIGLLAEGNYPGIVSKGGLSSTSDGYFEFDVDDADIGSVLKIEMVAGWVTRGVNVKPNIGLFVVMEEKPVPEWMLNMTTGPLVKVRAYKREFTADTAYVWHPEDIHIVWPHAEIEFRLPYEKERSGVANLLFRDKKSGDIRLLDTIRDNRRCYNRFESGSYDAILLYNNGKYAAYDNIVLEEGVKMVVDMAGQAVRPADKNSRKWLLMRKFTDVVGERTLTRWYAQTSPEKVSGYIFEPYKEQVLSWVNVRRTPAMDKRTFSSDDGYFEFDTDAGDAGSMLEISNAGYENMEIKIKPNSAYFIVMERTPGDVPKMIGTGSSNERE